SLIISHYQNNIRSLIPLACQDDDQNKKEAKNTSHLTFNFMKNPFSCKEKRVVFLIFLQGFSG
ncbi:MAG: hypothetical protein VXW16_02740, partial [Bacteroidota bacterium]|nr:hypothetical protein [Bacteroidota bacterium]